MNGSLYDDIRFSTIDGTRFLGGVAPRIGYKNAENLCNVWGFKDNHLVQFDFKNWSTFKQELKNPEFKEKLKAFWAAK
jgi:hypothetical protein